MHEYMCRCTHLCWGPRRTSGVLCYHSLSNSLEITSLIEPGARLTVSKTQWPPSLPLTMWRWGVVTYRMAIGHTSFLHKYLGVEVRFSCLHRKYSYLLSHLLSTPWRVSICWSIEFHVHALLLREHSLLNTIIVMWSSICCYKNISIVLSSYEYALYVKHVLPLFHHTSFPCGSPQPQTPCVMKAYLNLLSSCLHLLSVGILGLCTNNLRIFWNVITLCFEVGFFSSLLHGIWSIFSTSTPLFLISPSVFSKDVWPPGHFHGLISQLFHLIKKYQIFH